MTDLYQRLIDNNGSATLEERFQLYAGDRATAEIVRKNGSDQTLYFHTDELGSVSTLSNDAGASFDQDFGVFGMPQGPDPGLTRAGYTGHQHERDLGLVDMRGRMYDPLAGRFLSADPVSQAPFWSQGLNRYAYVFNDPANNTDPSGFFASIAIAAGHYGGVVVTSAQFFGTVGITGAGLASGVSNLKGLGSAGSTVVSSPPATASDPLADRSRFAGAEYAINRALHGTGEQDPARAGRIALKFWDARVNDVFYDPSLSRRGLDAVTDYYFETDAAAVTFGPNATSSARHLLSTAHHEGITHVGQFRSGNFGSGDVERAVNEIEALDLELAQGRRLGLNQAEMGRISAQRAAAYEQVVGTPYQSRVDVGNYQLVR